MTLNFVVVVGGGGGGGGEMYLGEMLTGDLKELFLL